MIGRLGATLAVIAATSAWLPATTARAQTCYIQPSSRVNDPYGCCTSGCSIWCSGRGSTAHRGVDYETGFNRALPAVADGVVVDVFWNSCLGNVLVLRHPDGAYSGYSHLYSVHVRAGQSVSRGQHIANSGNEGSCSMGAHLHLTMGWDFSCYRGVGRCFDAWAYIDTHRECRPDRDGDGSYEGDDCDDADAARRPGGHEVCDGRDNDCDPSIDESITRVCGTDEGECRAGVQTCMTGDWGTCVGEIPPVEESCDLLDNDCDATVDDERVCEHDDAALAASVLARVQSDVDGDGRADACVRTPGGFECLTSSAFGFDRALRGPVMADEDGWDQPDVYGSVRMADVDGDGMDDLCARHGERVVCWRSTGDGFEESLTTMPLGTPSPGARGAELWLADVDGDARADICLRGIDGLACQPSSGGSLRVIHALSDDEGFADVGRHGSIRFGDVNGDGRDDICARGEEGLWCWLAGSTAFDERIAGPSWSDALGWSEPRYGSTIRLADVNGDGRADACGRGPDGFVCWLATGRGFGAGARGPAMRGEEGWDDRAVYATIRVGDLDGDGSSDLCARETDGVHCWLWTGAGFGHQILGPRLSDADGWSAAPRYTSLRLADVSGDGLADLCARGADALMCWVFDGARFTLLWRGSAWNDAIGLSDPAFSASLTIAGTGTSAPSRDWGLTGSCASSAHGAGSNRGGWALPLLAVVVGLLRLRRRRS